MSRYDLPADSSKSLDFDGLIDTLARLEGEEVSVLLTGIEPGEAPGRPGVRVELLGELRRVSSHALPETECFSVGPSPGIQLPRAEFVAAHLSTLDSNFYFAIKVEMRGIDFVLGQPDLIGT
jgi:hypothetical protein